MSLHPFTQTLFTHHTYDSPPQGSADCIRVIFISTHHLFWFYCTCAVSTDEYTNFYVAEVRCQLSGHILKVWPLHNSRRYRYLTMFSGYTFSSVCAWELYNIIFSQTSYHQTVDFLVGYSLFTQYSRQLQLNRATTDIDFLQNRIRDKTCI
jgi:hypothetical protein